MMIWSENSPYCPSTGEGDPQGQASALLTVVAPFFTKIGRVFTVLLVKSGQICVIFRGLSETAVLAIYLDTSSIPARSADFCGIGVVNQARTGLPSGTRRY